MFNRESLENPVVLLGLAVLVLALITVASSSGRLLLTLFHTTVLDDEPVAQTQSTNTFSSSSIIERNFFGLASEKPVVEVDALPETKLELTLRGAFAAAEGQVATAIIQQDSNNVTDAYNVGDQVPGGAELSAVYPGRVVLSRNGLLETLYFPEDFDSNGVGSRVNKNASPTQEAAAQRDPDAEARRKAIRDRIRQLRNKR